MTCCLGNGAGSGQAGRLPCKLNDVEPYAYLRDLFTSIATGHLDKDIDALMPWAYAAATKTSQ